jgi:alpha-L-arabinofuranosidase
VFVLQSEDLKTENSLDHPTKLAPVEKQLQVSGGEFPYELLPRSFTVLRIPLK